MEQFTKFTKEEKLKQIDKMINYVKQKVKDAERFSPEDFDNELYYECRTAGHMFYEFMCDHLKLPMDNDEE